MSVTAGSISGTHVELVEGEVADIVRALNQRLRETLECGGPKMLGDAALIADRIVEIISAHRATTPAPHSKTPPNPGGVR